MAAANPAYACCTFRGSLAALDANSGKVLWKTYRIEEAPKKIGQSSVGTQQMGPSGAALWSSPTLDLERNIVYAATGVNYSDPPTGSSDAVLAFDRRTGRLLWSRQLLPADVFNFGCTTEQRANCPGKPGQDGDIGAPPILRLLGGGRRLLIVGAKSGVVYGLDPDHEGTIVWQQRLAKGGPQGGIMWGGAADDRLAYFSISDWDAGKGEAGGGVTAIEIATGKTAWTTPAPRPAGLGRPGCSAGRAGNIDIRSSVFRVDGWPPTGLRRANRRHHLGL